MREGSKQNKEIRFIPRIVNPVKMKRVVIFSADEQIRETKAVLEKNMPWVKIDVLFDPVSTGSHKSAGATTLVLDDVALNLVDTERIKRNNKDIVVVLLSAKEFIHCSPPLVAQEKLPYTAKADLIFAFNKTDCAPDKIIQSVVRSAEDLLNISKYSKVRRFIFLIVDDEPRWFSQFFPILYSIIGQRADVMIVRTYEEAMEFIFGVKNEAEINPQQYMSSGHGDDVVCIITDIFFPKNNHIESDAGRNLIHLIQLYYPRIPIIIASKTKEAEVFRDSSFILPKGDPGSLATLRKYIQDYTGMGDFIIRNDAGEVTHRIKNIQEMIEILDQAGKNTPEGIQLREILESYGKKDSISTWLYMHSFRELGDVLRPIQVGGQKMINVLKKHLKEEVRRMDSTPLYIENDKASDLEGLLRLLEISEPSKIQILSNNDVFSSWLDRKGYTELAEELRPIHGTGKTLVDSLLTVIEKWIRIYENAK